MLYSIQQKNKTKLKSERCLCSSRYLKCLSNQNKIRGRGYRRNKSKNRSRIPFIVFFLQFLLIQSINRCMRLHMKRTLKYEKANQLLSYWLRRAVFYLHAIFPFPPRSCYFKWFSGQDQFEFVLGACGVTLASKQSAEFVICYNWEGSVVGGGLMKRERKRKISTGKKKTYECNTLNNDPIQFWVHVQEHF